MVLLYNVYLDNKVRIPGLFYRGLYEDYEDNINIFKYTLNSVSKIYPWTKVIINFEVNPILKHREEELISYIKELFKDYNLKVNNTRCSYQSEWKKLYEELNDDIICLKTNHDHVFISESPDEFIKDIESFKEQFSESEASLFYSHFQENLVLNTQHKTLSNNPKYVTKDSYILQDRFLITLGDSIDGTQIITKKLYHTWWFTGEFEHMFLPRTDYANIGRNLGKVSYDLPNNIIKFQAIVYKEHFKHFDGYSHIPNIIHNNLQGIASNTVCPLRIPPGFFKNKIKLRVGYKTLKKDCININLSKENYTVVDLQGTDLKCYVNEIPYFWKDKIIEINVNSNYIESNYSEQRDKSIIYPLISNLFHGSIKDDNILNKIKNTYNIK